MSTERECSEINLPPDYSQTTYQPRQYCTEIDRDGQAIRVFLHDFIYRTGPGDVENPGQR